MLVALSALVPSHCTPVCAPSQVPAVLARLAMLYVHDEAPYDVVRPLRSSVALSLPAMIGTVIATFRTLIATFRTLVPIIRTTLVMTCRTPVVWKESAPRSGL